MFFFSQKKVAASEIYARQPTSTSTSTQLWVRIWRDDNAKGKKTQQYPVIIKHFQHFTHHNENLYIKIYTLHHIWFRKKMCRVELIGASRCFNYLSSSNRGLFLLQNLCQGEKSSKIFLTGQPLKVKNCFTSNYKFKVSSDMLRQNKTVPEMFMVNLIK